MKKQSKSELSQLEDAKKLYGRKTKPKEWVREGPLVISRQNAEHLYYDDWQPDRKQRVPFSWKETPEEIKKYLRTEAIVKFSDGKLKFAFGDVVDGPLCWPRIRKQLCVWVRKDGGDWMNTGNIVMQEEIDKAVYLGSAELYMELLNDTDVLATTGERVYPVDPKFKEYLAKNGIHAPLLYTDKEHKKYFQQCNTCRKIFPYSRKYFRAIHGLGDAVFPILRPMCKDCKVLHEKANEQKREPKRQQNYMKEHQYEGFVYLLFMKKKDDLVFKGIYTTKRQATIAREKLVKNTPFKHWLDDKEKMKELFPIHLVAVKKSLTKTKLEDIY